MRELILDNKIITIDEYDRLHYYNQAETFRTKIARFFAIYESFSKKKHPALYKWTEIRQKFDGRIKSSSGFPTVIGKQGKLSVSENCTVSNWYYSPRSVQCDCIR